MSERKGPIQSEPLVNGNIDGVRVPQTTELSPQRLAKLRQQLDAFLLEPGSDEKELRVISNVLPDIQTTKNQMIVAPVGSGKTLGAAPEILLGGKDIIAPRRIIIVQPTQQLCANASEILATLYGQDIVGHRYGGLDTTRVKNADAKIMVVTTGVLWNMFKRGYIGKNDYVLFDEIHQTMGFAQIEAVIGSLVQKYEQGERDIGIGFATGTFPTGSESGRRFLDFAQSSLLETGEKSRWKRELLPGGKSIEVATKNYLKDHANNGRNLLVLVPTNKKVDDLAAHLGNWQRSGAKQNTEGEAQRSTEKMPAQPFRVVYFSKDIGAGEFNRQVGTFLSDRAKARKSGQKFNERLVIIATYGSAGSGVNYPVEDAIGDATYISAVDEDGQSVRLQEKSVEGSILQQAFGRIGRHTDGRFFLIDYDGEELVENMIKPDPLPMPLQTASGLQEAVFGLIEAKVDPRQIKQWYSGDIKDMQRKIEKTYALLASRGLLKEGKITDAARNISRNPLAESNLDYALVVESAEPELQAGLQEILSTAAVASWKSLFIKDFIQNKENDRAEQSILSLLVAKGLIRKVEKYYAVDSDEITEDSEKEQEYYYCMPDNDEPLPDSDTAVIINVARYLRNLKIDVYTEDETIGQRDASVGEIARRYNFSYKALERLFVAINQAESYSKYFRWGSPYYYNKTNWEPYLRTLIETNSISLAQPSNNHTIVSDGVYKDNLTNRKEDPQYVASLFITKARGKKATNTTTFTGSVLGPIPEDLIPWLPDNLRIRASNTISEREFSIFKRKNEVEEQAYADEYPNLYSFLKQCKEVEQQLASLVLRAKDNSIPQFNFDTWYQEFVLTHMMVQKVDSLDGLDTMLDNLKNNGVSVSPDLYNFVSKRKVDDIEKQFPTKLPFGNSYVTIEYSKYSGPLVHFHQPLIPIENGQFDLQAHPIKNGDISELQALIDKTSIADTVRIELFGTTYSSLTEIASIQPKKLDSAIVKGALKQMAEHKTLEIHKKIKVKEVEVAELYELLGRIRCETVAHFDGNYLRIMEYLKTSYSSASVYELVAEGIFKDKSNDSIYNDTTSYKAQAISDLTTNAYQVELLDLQTQLKNVLDEVATDLKDQLGVYGRYQSWMPQTQFKQIVSELATHEIEFMVAMATQELDASIGTDSVSSFNVEEYKSTIEAFFQTYREKLATLKQLLSMKPDLAQKLSIVPHEVRTTFITRLGKIVESNDKSNSEMFRILSQDLEEIITTIDKKYSYNHDSSELQKAIDVAQQSIFRSRSIVAEIKKIFWHVSYSYVPAKLKNILDEWDLFEASLSSNKANPVYVESIAKDFESKLLTYNTKLLTDYVSTTTSGNGIYARIEIKGGKVLNINSSGSRVPMPDSISIGTSGRTLRLVESWNTYSSFEVISGSGNSSLTAFDLGDGTYAIGRNGAYVYSIECDQNGEITDVLGKLIGEGSRELSPGYVAERETIPTGNSLAHAFAKAGFQDIETQGESEIRARDKAKQREERQPRPVVQTYASIDDFVPRPTIEQQKVGSNKNIENYYAWRNLQRKTKEELREIANTENDVRKADLATVMAAAKLTWDELESQTIKTLFPRYEDAKKRLKTLTDYTFKGDPSILEEDKILIRDLNKTMLVIEITSSVVKKLRKEIHLEDKEVQIKTFSDLAKVLSDESTIEELTTIATNFKSSQDIYPDKLGKIIDMYIILREYPDLKINEVLKFKVAIRARLAKDETLSIKNITKDELDEMYLEAIS